MADDSAAPGTRDHAALIVAVAERRDRTAFAELFDYFAPRIKALLRRGGTPAELAEELAQEAMLIVWRKAHLFDPGGASASGWIFRISNNLRIDAARRSRRADRMASELALDAPDVEVPDAILDVTQTEARVRSAMAQLPADQLKVITLSFLESRPHSEIAQILQVPLGTVKSRIRLAFQRLRSLLDEVA
jgi:RNA polymerase sigma-70 factor (ECF subfamily)